MMTIYDKILEDRQRIRDLLYLFQTKTEERQGNPPL